MYSYRGVPMVASAFLLTVTVFAPLSAVAQSVTGTANYAGSGYALTVPLGWIQSEREFKGKGGTAKSLLVYQINDATSRTTKYFELRSGATETIFGLRPKLIQRISKEQLIDFYIDQQRNASIDYTVTKTSIQGEGEKKVYVIEANSAVPGYRMFSVTYITFRGGKTFMWGYSYLNAFSYLVPSLQNIASSVQVQ